MSESEHLRRDLAARCVLHPLVEEEGRSYSTDATEAFFCRNCGLAFTNSAGFFLRPNRFEGMGSPAAPHDILFQNMILRQTTHRPLSSEHVNQPLRLQAIKGLWELTGEFGLQKMTFVRAVALLDKFLSCGPVNPLDYNLVMFITLNLAWKFGEQKPNKLTVPNIAHFLPGSYGSQEVALWEIHIIAALGWNMDVQTAHDFANYFMWQGVATTPDVERLARLNDTDPATLLDCLDDLVTQILDITLTNFGFYRYKPVGLAASAIATARELLGMSPWTNDLKVTTTFSLDDLTHCSAKLRQLINQDDTKVLITAVLARYQLIGLEDPVGHAPWPRAWDYPPVPRWRPLPLTRPPRQEGSRTPSWESP